MNLNQKYFRLAAKIAAWMTGSAEDRDEEELKIWKEENIRNRKLFQQLTDPQEYLKNQYTLKQFPVEEGWRKIENRLDGRKETKLRRIGWMKYVAVIVLCMGVGVVYLATRPKKVIHYTTLAQTTIPSGTQAARLILGDGRMVEVTREKQFTISEKDGTVIRKDSAGLNYSLVNIAENTEIWNQMETLTGMEYRLTLSDGTQVYLNAESRIKFPVAFKGKERVVELSGEAYFKVVKNTACPFIVRLDGAEVKVLGTSFNVRSYANENGVVTTLVEGKVEMNGRNMLPGQQAVYLKDSGKLSVADVSIDQYIAWGVLFSGMNAWRM